MLQLLLSLFLATFGGKAVMPAEVFSVALSPTETATLHSDGMISLLSVSCDAGFASFYRRGPQGPIGNAENPAVQTTWVDRAGVTHSVSTPIPSATPAGLTRATQLHNQLVALMQAQFPPRAP